MPVPLSPPPPILATDNSLPVTRLLPRQLVRISQYPSGEPFFGASGSNRFDAPGCLTGAPEFRSCYLGFTLEVAIAETLLHDEIPVNGAFRFSVDALNKRYVHRFSGSALRMLDLTGATLKRLSGHADLAGTASYEITRQWSLAVFCNPQNFDGFMYMSRHLNTERAVILFDRAAHKLHAKPNPMLLPDTSGFAAAVRAFNIIAA